MRDVCPEQRRGRCGRQPSPSTRPIVDDSHRQCPLLDINAPFNSGHAGQGMLRAVNPTASVFPLPLNDMHGTSSPQSSFSSESTMPQASLNRCFSTPITSSSYSESSSRHTQRQDLFSWPDFALAPTASREVLAPGIWSMPAVAEPDDIHLSPNSSVSSTDMNVYPMRVATSTAAVDDSLAWLDQLDNAIWDTYSAGFPTFYAAGAW